MMRPNKFSLDTPLRHTIEHVNPFVRLAWYIVLIGFAVAAVVSWAGCSSTSASTLLVPTAVDAPITPAPAFAPIAAVPPSAPAPAPAPAPAIAPAVRPCTGQPPPAAGVGRVLLCVTSAGGTRAVEAAEVTYASQYQGLTDSNGQYLLHVRGYGGTQDLTIYHAAYSLSPLHLTISLREEMTQQAIDLGDSLR